MRPAEGWTPLLGLLTISKQVSIPRVETGAGLEQVQGCWRHLARRPHTPTPWSLTSSSLSSDPMNSPCPTWMPTNVP